MATLHPDHSLISSQDVQGTTVYGSDNEAIGEIDHLLIEKMSGKVAYAVMSFGGFLGLAHSHYPIPWSASGTIQNSEVTEHRSPKLNCKTHPMSELTSREIVIGKHARMSIMVRPPIGARPRRICGTYERTRLRRRETRLQKPRVHSNR